MFNSLLRKLSTAGSVLRQQGLLEFLIRGLQFLQKKIRRHQIASNKPITNNIYTKARYKDIIAADFKTKRTFNTSAANKSLAWIMPPPGKGSGGHLNIFRFINYLEKAGYICHIYLYVDGPHAPIDDVLASMGGSYPNINASKNMKWLEDDTEISNVDGIFATSWETAYASYAQLSNVYRFYFIQDFEPFFYPVGGMYSLAENTYKLGFYGITAGNWLKEKLSVEYSMDVASFDFSSDASIYRHTNTGSRKEIFCYTRPYTERRGFEVGILTLDIFHKMHPDYTINLVGWDVSEYTIPFPHVNLKTLEISELSELYNRCAAGLVLSYTNMSLLPLELLRCGTIPVVNDAPNNRLVSDNKFIAYTANNPHSLAQMLSDVVSRDDATEYAQHASESVQGSSWDQSGARFIEIIEKEIRP